MFWQADTWDDALVIPFVCLFHYSPWCIRLLQCPVTADGFDILLTLVKDTHCSLVIKTCCVVRSISTGWFHCTALSTIALLSSAMKPSLKANPLAEMVAPLGSSGSPGVLHYCLLIKYLVSQLLAAQQRLDHTGSAGQEGGRKVEIKGAGEAGHELFGSSCFGSSLFFPPLCVLEYLLLLILWCFSWFTLC